MQGEAWCVVRITVGQRSTARPPCSAQRAQHPVARILQHWWGAKEATMECSNLMKRDVECCGLDDTVEHVAARMAERGIGFIPVCDAGGEMVGTLTDRDIVLRVVATGRLAAQTPVSEVFTREVIGCSEADELAVAEALMSRHKKSRIVCFDARGKLSGVISLSDIARIETGARSSALLRSVAQREARA
jgi:CBS domain-containing protein